MSEATNRDETSTRRLREALSGSRLIGGLEVLASTGSTNADLAARAVAGAAAGEVLVAAHQSSGRGRLGRSWSAPPGASAAVSLLLRPAEGARRRWGWLTLALALAVHDALRGLGVPASLKWPNDVLGARGKVCGILAEVVATPQGPACVLGCGINLSLTPQELPVPTASSLAIEGASSVELVEVVAAVLAAFERRHAQWLDADPGLARDYRAACSSLGAELRVLLGGGEATGTGIGIDDDGRLVVATARGRRAFASGDVVHLR